MTSQKITIHISGMSCGHCSRYVTNTINELEGIVHTEVSHETGIAQVEYDAEKIDSKHIIEAIGETHYTVVSVD